MLKRIIGAAVASAAAIGVAAAVKLIVDRDNNEEENEDEVRFVSLDDAEETPEEVKEEEFAPEINEIAELYPYLAKTFIAEQFARNEVFNEQYPEDSLVTITHKAKFEDGEVLGEFTKIGEDNGYTAEVLNETEAAITRKMFTEDGSILSDIYNVANQVACLKGTYEGYNIEL
ncbi:MAG: hypothetical protein IJ225_08375 [Solobacterium sp.]|nr:hypothetical protein [Solobacterium sp.]